MTLLAGAVHFSASGWVTGKYNDSITTSVTCLIHLFWIRFKWDLNGLYVEMSLALVTFVAWLQCLSPMHIILQKAIIFPFQLCSPSLILSLEICIILHITLWVIIILMCLSQVCGFWCNFSFGKTQQTFLVSLAEEMSALEVLFSCVCAAKFLQPPIIYIYFTLFFLDREVL